MTSYVIDIGLVVAAERAGQHSHGIMQMLAEYKWWANLAAENPRIKEAAVSADIRASRLRNALIENCGRTK